LDCHSGVQRCPVFKSGGQAVDQIRKGPDKSNVLHGLNRSVPKMGYYPAMLKKIRATWDSLMLAGTPPAFVSGLTQHVLGGTAATLRVARGYSAAQWLISNDGFA